jgi:hypothetical protein
MDALLERLSSGQIVAIISIFVGGIVAMAMIVAISKYQFQSLADDTALKQEKQLADLALRDKLIERREAEGAKTPIGELLALGAESASDVRPEAELAKRFGLLDASAEDIQGTLQLALATDPERKRMIVAVMDELFENEAESSAILAAVRPLCANGPLGRMKVSCQEKARC